MVNSYFRVDLNKYYCIELKTAMPPLMRRLKFWAFHFGLHCVAIFRLGQFSNRLFQKSRILGLPFVIIHRVLSYTTKFIHHVDIDDYAKIGPGFYIGHVGTIYVGATTIGTNCSLHHNTVIGKGHSEGKEGVPIIGDDVWIGTGSVLVGAITIGNRVTISPGSIVTRSIPDNCLVAGNPARVTMKDYNNIKLFGKRSFAQENTQVSTSNLE